MSTMHVHTTLHGRLHDRLRGTVRSTGHWLALALVLTLSLSAVADDIRLPDGSRWRGDVGDRVEVAFVQSGVELSMTGEVVKITDNYIRVSGELAGTETDKIIFIHDIRTMERAKDTLTDDERASRKPTSPQGEATGRQVRQAPAARSSSSTDVTFDSNAEHGVFYLPMEGPVGEEFRAEEIRLIGDHADQWGPGQIIIIEINSNGGLVLMAQRIKEEIFELRKRHRVIAWVDKAISAGAWTAMCCNEIYFKTTGSAGSVTTLAGGRSVAEEDVAESIEDFARMAQESGYSEHIARAMKLNKHMCSYDRDEETGEITFYGDLSGEYILSDGNSNLNFNATTAEHCGFSKGTADTFEELAALLDLPEWTEKSDYGREIAEKWQKTVERFREDIQLINARLSYLNTGTGDPVVILGTQIRLLEQLLQWHNRAPFLALMNLPSKEQIERTIAEYRKQLADMRRRR